MLHAPKIDQTLPKESTYKIYKLTPSFPIHSNSSCVSNVTVDTPKRSPPSANTIPYSAYSGSSASFMLNDWKLGEYSFLVWLSNTRKINIRFKKLSSSSNSRIRKSDDVWLIELATIYCETFKRATWAYGTHTKWYWNTSGFDEKAENANHCCLEYHSLFNPIRLRSFYSAHHKTEISELLDILKFVLFKMDRLTISLIYTMGPERRILNHPIYSQLPRTHNQNKDAHLFFFLLMCQLIKFTQRMRNCLRTT